MRVNREHFQAFFSYSHDDEEINPTLVEQLTVDFQREVQGAIVNCGFVVFKDKSGLRTGDRIQAAILAQMRASDILLILLTPNWLSSDYCRNEYHEYVKLEAARNRGPTIVAVIPTDLTAEREYFDAEQEGIVRDLLDRLAFSAQGKNATPSGAMKAAARRSLVQDTRTIIARLRSTPAGLQSDIKAATTGVGTREFGGQSHNYLNFDVVTDSTIRLASGGGVTRIRAQVDFTERLYVDAGNSQIHFGVSRAYLSVFPTSGAAFATGDKSKVLDFQRHRDRANGLTFAILPQEGRRTLGPLSLPVDAGANQLCTVATISGEYGPGDIDGELRIYLRATDLVIRGANTGLNGSSRKRIAAIMEAAIRKREFRADEEAIVKPVPVSED